MALIYNGTEIPATGSIRYGSTEVKKVIYGTTTVWTKREYKTGALVKMTSNNAPAPYTVTAWCDGTFWGDDNSLAYKAFSDQYFYQQANVSGKYCGATLMFNTTKKIFPVKIHCYGANADAGEGGGGGSLELQYRNASGTWVQLGKWEDPNGGRDVTMDGTTQVTGLRVRTIYGSGPAKWLEVGYTYITQWYEEEV